MKSNRSLVSISLAVVMAVGLTPALASCANPIQAIIQKGVQDVATQAAGGDVNLNVNGSGASMPQDWPSVIPVIAGTIQSSVRLGSGDSETWSVSITVGNAASAWESIKTDMTTAGFNNDYEATTSDGSTGSFSNGTYVAVVSVGADSASGATVTYVVSVSTATPQ